MEPTHYHLKLFFSGTCLQDVEWVKDRQAALDRARHYTEQVQARMSAQTYRVRVEPCSLVHFPGGAGSHRLGS
jgi:hypothetical protein